jgi:pyruvate kinase
MLSGETAKGDFPVICVKTMAKIAKEAEACIWNERIFEDMMRRGPETG